VEIAHFYLFAKLVLIHAGNRNILLIFAFELTSLIQRNLILVARENAHTHASYYQWLSIRKKNLSIL
jgi:hypothetical protein